MTPIKKLMAFLVIFCCFNISGRNAHGTWSSDPSVNNAICKELHHQQDPSIISDGNGGAIITWWDTRADRSDIYA